MRIARYVAPVIIALALLHGVPDDAAAQVVEAREADANPAEVLFRATLYGAGTGLALGGAYALIDDDGDPGTGEILKWGVAGGAGAGFLIGLIYVAVRPQPEGSIGDEGLVQVTGKNLQVSPIGLLDTGGVLSGPDPGALELNLVGVRF